MSDLPIASMPLPEIEPWPSPVSQIEIDQINERHCELTRQTRKLFKECCDMGDWFRNAHDKLIKQRGRYCQWNEWLKQYFPKIPFTTVFGYTQIAAHRDFLRAVHCQEVISQSEALRLIRAKNREERKPRIRRTLVREDAEPLVVLEAKLKSYVINLWMLKYLQTEIQGLIESAELKSEQLMRVLHYVCKEHQEVQDDVIRTFQPGLKIVKKGA